MRVSPRKGGDHHITLRPLTVQDNTGALKAMEVSPFVRFERRNLDLGVMLYRQRDYLGSIRVLGKYLQDYPPDGLARQYLTETHIQQGRQLIQQGKKEEALASFEKAQRLDEPDTPELINQIRALKKNLDEEYYQQGLRVYQTDLTKAMQHWQRSLQYDPNHVQAGVRLEQSRQIQKKLKTIQ